MEVKGGCQESSLIILYLIFFEAGVVHKNPGFADEVQVVLLASGLPGSSVSAYLFPTCVLGMQTLVMLLAWQVLSLSASSLQPFQMPPLVALGSRAFCGLLMPTW